MTLDDVLDRYPEAEAFTFGDSREMCDALLALVRSGKKTATCGALRDFIEGDDPMPEVGRQDVALDWDDNPALVIETVEVKIRRFGDVDAEFALAEGEADSLAGWAEGHRTYFELNGGWSAGMELVCERFRVIEDLQPAGEAAP
jgi:uncharacterized protein YhfF